MKCRYFCRLPLDISPVYLTRGISATSTRLYETAALKIKAAVSLRLHKPMTGTIYKSSCEGLGTDTYFYIKGIETAWRNGIAAYQESRCAEDHAIWGFSENTVPKSRRYVTEPNKTNGLYSEKIRGNRFAGKRIFGIGRVFHAERSECQMLCGIFDSI